MRKPSLSGQIVIGVALGVLTGILFGRGAQGLGSLGKVIIDLVKMAATPLLFLSIVSAILRTEVSARNGGRMVAIASFNASLALLAGLLFSNFFEPGRHLESLDLAAATQAGTAPAPKKLDFAQSILGHIPTDLVTPFAQNAVLSVVILALLTGFGLRALRRVGDPEELAGLRGLESAVAALLRLTQVVLGWFIRLIPLAVFGVVAKSVGEYGFSPLQGLAAYVGVGIGGLAFHALVVYQAWLLFVARVPLGRFWREAREPMVNALGANSSLATLPLTLKALDRLGVSRSSSTLGACVGTNLNNDGIILYEGMAVLFVAQAYGMHLSLGEQALAAVSCIVAAMGIAGVPEAGVVSLSLVLGTIGLPVEIVPLLLTVDWIVARGRSVVNVLSDMMVSILLDRWEGRKVGAEAAVAAAAPARSD